MLVGVPGAGKSTVGPILAAKLGWRFVDFDPAIEKETGLTIREIFTQLGEAEFRRRESDLTARLASERQLVLAPGGGWILRNTLPDALLVWLQVDAGNALQRMGDDVNARPLLRDNPLSGMQRILNEREQHYSKADIHIDTTGMTPEAVADAVVVAIKEKNGDKEI